MTIQEELKKRICDYLTLKDFDDQIAAIDAIQIIHEGWNDHFSEKFNNMISGTWGSQSSNRTTTAKRLLAMLEAEEFKNLHFPGAISGDGLLPLFSLDDADKSRMLKLAADIRRIVTASTDFDEPHKVRLLNRVAAMENEVHRERGRFDVFLGGLSDFGETAGKFGRDIKPLTDRVREMVGIARKNTKEYEKLEPPEEMKELPHPDEYPDETD